MKNIMATAAFLLISVSGISIAAADCGDVTISNMNWQSAEVLASVDKFILNNGFGCNAELIVGDTVPTVTSMIEKGQPDIAPEGWIDLLPDVINAGLAEDKLVKGAVAISDGAIQGWWIPKQLADAHPDIKTIDDVMKRPDLFPAPEDKSKGAVYNGPQGWGGTLVTTQLFNAYEGEKNNFVLLDTGSSAGLDGSIAKAIEREEGWVGYYWSPTALLGKYEMVKLDYGVPFDEAEWKRCNTVADCPDPKRNEWPVDTVQTLMTKSFSERADKELLNYLNTRSWDNATVNKLMAWMTDNQASGDDAARHFLAENEELWSKWVSPEVATKLKAAL